MKDYLKYHPELTPEHLQAIGLIAVEWSALEALLLSSLARMSATGHEKTTILAAPSAFASWLDMLVIFSRSPLLRHREKAVEKLCVLMKKLLRLRNHIIHATWQEWPRVKNIPRNTDVYKIAVDAATAYAIPKRGLKSTVHVAWKHEQMMQVVDAIKEAQLILFETCDQRPPTSAKKRNAESRLCRANLLRIQRTLDKLPDPFLQLLKYRPKP